MNKQRKTSHILNVFQYDADGHVVLPASLTLSIAPASNDDSSKVPTTAWVRALASSLGYVTLSTDQTITGLKTIVRSGDVLNFKIGTDTLYGLKVFYSQNELVESGEATWSFASTFNNGSGTGITTTPISFFRGVLVTGQRLLSSSVNANLLDYYANNLSGRYPIFAYNTGVQQFASSIIVGETAGVVNAITGAIADLPSGVIANFKGRVIGSNAVNNNEFITLGQLSANNYATQSYVGTQVANLVDAAPGTLDTLNELAAALGDDPNFATTVSTSIGTKVPQARTLTINGTSYDLSADRSWTINSMVYPSAGIALSTGTAWGTSITDNSGNWNTAYGWGNHASAGYLTSATAATTYVSLSGSYANPAWITSLGWGKITSTPTTISGYGITNAYTDAQIQNFFNGANTITGYNKSNWDTAYGWGNHAVAGYLTSLPSHNQAWSTITSTPTTLAGYGIGDAVFTSTSSFTTAGTGWYRVATTAGDGRGYYYIEVYTTGGNHNPSYLRIEAMGDWGNDKLIAAYTDQGFPASAVRITRTASTTFLEVNFTTTILGANLRVVRLGFDSGVSVLSGALSAGGGTIQETLTISGKISAASMSIAGNTVLHAGNYNSYSPTLTGVGASGTNWGISITGNAATVGGYAVSGTVGANTVVIRDVNGYIYAHYINSNVSETENPTINSFYTSNGDGWLRKSSLAHVRSQLGNYGNWITGYTETDTLASVTGRGASTSTAVTFNNSVTINGTWQTNISTTGGWTRLSFVATNSWGDGITYGTLGASGGAEPGVMIYNQHSTWVDSSSGAGIRMGRSGGVSSGAWYQVATMSSDEFMIAKNGNWSNGGIKILSDGAVNYGNTGYRFVHNNGTWDISINGNATYALNSTRLYASDAPYTYGGSSPYYMTMTYDGTRWLLQVTPGTPAAVRVAYSDVSGSSNSVAWGNISSRPSTMMYYQGFTLDANTIDSNATGFTYSVNAPYTGPIIHIGASGYGMQFNANYGDGTLLAYRVRNGDNGTWNSWRRLVYNSGTWDIAITGNSGNTSSISNAVGGAYTWTGINYFRSNRNTSSDSPPLQAYSDNGSGAIMSFHRSGLFAVNFGLDSDNVMRIGGWSASTNRWQLDMSGNNWAAGSFRAPIFFDSDDTTYYINPSSTTSLRTVGSWRADSSSWDGEFNGKIQYHSNNWYFQAAGDWYFRNSGSSNVFSVNQSGNISANYVNAPSGYVSNGNPWSTANSAFFPNGITTAGGTNWIYGSTTYIGNATGNGAGHDFFSSGSSYSTGNLETNGSFRAPIFYDRNDTTYYIDLNSTTSGVIRGNFIFNDFGAGIVGTYSASRYQGVFSMGDAYKLPIDGTGPSNLYGIAWSHPNAGGVAGNLNTHGALFLENGTFLAAISGSIRARDDMRAPIFYDSNDTTYYLNPASTSQLNTINQWGWTYQYSNNGIYWASYSRGFAAPEYEGNSYGTITTIGSGRNGWSGYGIGSRHVLMSTTGDNIGIHDNSRGWLYYWNGNHHQYSFGYLEAQGSMRSPIFYDSANTGYYLDPNGGSYLASSIEIANGYLLTNGVGGTIWMSSAQGSFGGYMRFGQHAVFESINGGYNFYVLDASGVGVVKTSGSQSWAAHSDSRIKNIHSVMENNLSKLESISPVYYSFNYFEDNRNRIGLIAQEVQEHFPELVDTDPKTDNLVLDYTGLIPVLLGAIKELKNKVEDLESRL